VSARPDFADILTSVAEVDGWMTDDQARRLHDRAAGLGPGARIVEIGSFRGRSLIVLARAAVDGVEIISIDPHAGNDRGPQEIAADQDRGDDDHVVYRANLEAAGVHDRIIHIRKMSDEARGDVTGEVDLLYIDGAHRFGPARCDIVDWGARVSGGGTMLIHDSFSSIGVTLALISSLFLSGEWRYVGRAQSMAEYRRERLGPGERAVNVLRQILQLPWFVRNVVVKVLLTAKLYPLTRILGHRTRDWPY
jgi:predicted O-methyltransferase YrrM